ncbi:E3 ubiquitin-protein ligase Praja-1-like isoform X1 [Ananas comosus]|uniref:RING-type E3 ubiquitin transferase n=1 Tax=Ananas comosus TaxID=4615 RepID=A0A6P5GCD1_ANACO|nr:E3 ubiquitin-protein ligase Praja-1-like isoform X1 [Ananas comosus]
MDERMGRRTACGLLSTRGGSIPIFREEKFSNKSVRCCDRISCSAGLFSKKGKQMNRQENDESVSAPSHSTISKITKQSSHRKSFRARSGSNQRDVESDRENSSNPSAMRKVSSQSTSCTDKSASHSARADRKKNSLTNSKDRLMSLVKRSVALDALRLYCPSSENHTNRGLKESRKRSLSEERSSSKSKNAQTSPNASSSGSPSASSSCSVSRAQQAPKRTRTQKNAVSVKVQKNPIKQTQRNASKKQREGTSRSSNNANSVDQHREMRMDIDGMTYEELLALGEMIGIVSTGLSEEALSECIKISAYVPPASSRAGSSDCEDGDIRCSICQEEYVCGDEVGKLVCKHYYHGSCINQWFQLKNWCPVCRFSAAK